MPGKQGLGGEYLTALLALQGRRPDVGRRLMIVVVILDLIHTRLVDVKSENLIKKSFTIGFKSGLPFAAYAA